MPSAAPSSSRHFLFLVSSARRHGNTEQLARRAAAVIPSTVEQTWINLADLPLPAFADLRHASTESWAPTIEGHALTLLNATLAATDIVIIAPLYWYSLPAAAKLYLDHWSAWLRVGDFKSRMASKTLWGVTTYSDNDPRFAEPLKETLRLSADYMHMNWGGHLLGSANRPGDVVNDTTALAAADNFFAQR